MGGDVPAMIMGLFFLKMQSYFQRLYLVTMRRIFIAALITLAWMSSIRYGNLSPVIGYSD